MQTHPRRISVYSSTVALLCAAGCAAMGGHSAPMHVPDSAAGGVVQERNAATGVGFVQYPALSPDGSTIVFNWLGDLWAVPAAGGTATRLTSSPANDQRANFSPDGTRIAFESDRDGGRSLYVMSVARSGTAFTTGNVKRVTVTDRAHELPSGNGGWTPDGAHLVFGERAAGIVRGSKMYKVPVDGGPVTAITQAYGQSPRASADGGSVVFARRRPEFMRPKYEGTGASDLWRMDVASGAFTQLTAQSRSEGDGFMLADGSLVYVGTKDGNCNVYRLAKGAAEADAVALTSFAPAAGQATIGHGVRDLSVNAAGTVAAFVVWDTLYTLDLTAAKPAPRAVSVTTAVDLNEVDYQRMNLAREVSEAVTSPDGKTVAVIARGEVFVRPAEEGRPTRRVTTTAGRESGLAWSPDGRVLWFASDEGGTNAIMYATVSLAREDLAPKDAKKDEPKEEPEKKDEAEKKDEPKKDDAQKAEGEKKDGTPSEGEKGAAEKKDDAKPAEKKPDFAKRWSEALRFDVKALDPALIPAGKNDGVLGMEVRAPIPSPDGRKLLVTRGLGDLVLIDLVAKKSRVLMESWTDFDVQWAWDSRHLVYAVEDLDFNSDVFILDTAEGEGGGVAAPVNVTRHPDLDTSPRLSRDGKVLYFLSERDGENFQFAVYGLYLDQKLESMPSYELEEYFKKQSTAAKSAKPIAPVLWDDAEWVSKDKPKAGKGLTFDFANAHLRVRRVLGGSGSFSGLNITPAGDRVLVSAPGEGALAEPSLVSVSFKGDDRKVVVPGGANGVTLSASGERLTFVKGRQAGGAPIAGGKVDTYAVDAPIVLDVKAAQRQKYQDAARIVGNVFYHPTLKGLDWKRLTERYMALAETTRTTAEFNRVFMMQLGELEGSHLGIMGGPAGFTPPALSIGALGADVEPVADGWKVTRLVFDSPTGKGASALKVGDVLTHVEERATAGQDLGAVMAGTAGRETLITVLRAGDGGEVKPVRMMFTPISTAAEAEMRYQDEVQRRAAIVEKASGGKLGYLHIRGMSMPSVRDFERDLFAAAAGKQGLIIDVRDNGGGSTADILLASLTAPTHAYTVPRGADKATTPRDAYPRDRRLIYGYAKPISVMINENSFSNAEIFAHAVKTIGRGRLVGTATYGGVISTGAASLVDGTTVRTPFRGWYLPGGEDMENNGARPDIDVPALPQDEAAGRDAQLEAAVAELLTRSAGK